MLSLYGALKAFAKRMVSPDAFVKKDAFDRSGRHRKPNLRSRRSRAARMEPLEKRALLAAAIMDGDWFDPNTWEGGAVPGANTPVIINHGITVQLDGSNHEAQNLTIHGNLVVPEEGSSPTDVNKKLTTCWIHVNSGGVFQVGSAQDRFDEGTFTLALNGTDKTADHVIATNMMGTNPGTMNVMNNDGFLMTAMEGSIQFYGEDKLSFTKLHTTAMAQADTIIVENIIERNYNLGASAGDQFVTSAEDDGELNWVRGDQIVIASSSYDYRHEEVRKIDAIADNGDGTSTLTLDEPLNHDHYGKIETYGENLDPDTSDFTRSYSIDLRAEVALLSRNVKIQGLSTQDTDVNFGDRAALQLEPRFRDANGNPIESDLVDEAQAKATGLSREEAKSLPSQKPANGVGAHIMIMPGSDPITVDGVQMDHMGQAGQKGRYPIHWHLGGKRFGDKLVNSSITNSNNRGVTIHGTSELTIEGVVLHDVHGHGFFFEDAVETGNVLVGNLALGIHTVGGNDANFISPGTKDPFIVDTHDSVLETGSRFSSSAGFWITNPTNTFVGNIVAGMGDQRPEEFAGDPSPAGTGFWYALPRTALGASSTAVDELGNLKYPDVTPIFGEFTQFDYNTSHTTAVGLNFDRGSDIEDATFLEGVNVNDIQPANEYSPRVGGDKDGDKTTNFVNGFTTYKASEAAFYHRGEAESIILNGLRVADSKNGPWAVSENKYNDSLFVGHSRGNSENDVAVGGPRLYDGSGLYTNTHFAGFANENAYTFQVEGSSFGPTMYHAFRGTSFEDDGSFDHIAHAVSDFTEGPDGEPQTTHNLGQPSQWIKAVLDLDGTLTGGFAGGGIGSSIVPNVDFLVDGDDTLLPGGEAWLTEDIYARMRIQNKDDGVPLFPPGNEGDPLVRFTAEDGDVIDVIGGQQIANSLYWTQIAAKADSDADGYIEDTLTVEFMRKGLPAGGFVLNMDNQDGGRPELVGAIDGKVNSARLVSRFVGAKNYTPIINNVAATEVVSEDALRSVSTGVAFYRDASGDLYLNTSIVNQPYIELVPGDPLQKEFNSEDPEFVPRKVQYGATIQAEEFDYGIDGIAYSDSDATNTLSSHRSDTGVDVSETVVGMITAGEWLEYTADILPTAYSIGLNVSSSQAGGQIRVSAAIDNSAGFLKELGTIDVPDTGGQFQTVWISQANLTSVAGQGAVIRLEFVDDNATGFVSDFVVDSIYFDEPIQTAYADRTDLLIDADLATTRIDLEHFDNGGQGVAYFDTEAGNDASDSFRADEDVDTAATQLEGRVFNGEWLEYTTDIHAGLYDITLRKAWGGDDSGVRLFVGDSNSATSFANLGVFSFAEGEFITLNDVDLSQWAGSDRVIRIEIVGNWMGLDYLSFVSKTQTPPTPEILDVTPSPRNTSVGEVTINFDEDVVGADIGDLSLTRDGNAVDISGLTLTQILPSQYSVDLSTVTTTSGDYELTLSSAGSGIQDLAGNALDTNAMEQFVIIEHLDYGDAPESYSTLFVHDGARHGAIGPQLGLTRNAESDGIASADADGDGAEEDGVMFGVIQTDRTLAAVNINLQNAASARIDAWLDFNGNGTWEEDEQILEHVQVIAGLQTLNFEVPAGTPALETYARVRVSSAGLLAPQGFAVDGEVEDYAVEIHAPPSVQQVIVNDGETQRSHLSKLVVKFDQNVDLAASAFEIRDRASGVVVDSLNVSSSVVDGKTTSTLTFLPGDSIVSRNGVHSLVDGNYQLSILGEQVAKVGGPAMSSDYQFGNESVDNFFRFFGDVDGDRDVDIQDLGDFGLAFRASVTDPNYNAEFDYNNDGDVDIEDLGQFGLRFRSALNY